MKNAAPRMCPGSRNASVSLPVGADEEDGNDAGAGVGADDRADIVDDDILDRGQGAAGLKKQIC